MSESPIPSNPTVLPGELDEILSEFAERSIRPTTLNILAAALDRGCPEDFAVTLMEAFSRKMEEANDARTEA